ncbi:hypothetical protein ACLB2K_007148 [Fragaria x ananassa]
MSDASSHHPKMIHQDLELSLVGRELRRRGGSCGNRDHRTSSHFMDRRQFPFPAHLLGHRFHQSTITGTWKCLSLKIALDTRYERYGVKKKETGEVNKDSSSETWTCLPRERGIPPRDWYSTKRHKSLKSRSKWLDKPHMTLTPRHSSSNTRYENGSLLLTVGKCNTRMAVEGEPAGSARDPLAASINFPTEMGTAQAAQSTHIWSHLQINMATREILIERSKMVTTRQQSHAN